jgi:phage portal protein BeeE
MDRGVKRRPPLTARSRDMFSGPTFGDVSRASAALLTNAGAFTRSLFGRGQRYWQTMYARSRINYRTEAGDPMMNSAYVAVVSWIARNAPDAPLVIERVYGDDARRERIGPGPTSPGRLLRLWERPNDKIPGPVMMAALVCDLYSGGDGYLVKVRNDAGMIVQLWWMPASIMEPWWQGDDFITAYKQTVEGTVYYWRPEDVYHFRLGVDPANPRKGRSPAASLLREIFTDNEASAFTAALLRNLGVPGVIIAPANTTGASIRGKAGAIKEQFKDTFGGDARGEPMVLTAPTEVKVLSFNPQQMELRDLLPEERISAVLGVAAIVAGLGAGLDRSTFSNFGEARRAAYTESITTLHRNIAATIELTIEEDWPDIGGSAETMLDVSFDWTRAAAMQEATGDVHKRSLEAASKGQITRAQYLRETGRPVDPTGLDDVYVIPNNFVTVPVGPPPVPSVTTTNGAGIPDVPTDSEDQAPGPAQEGQP